MIDEELEYMDMRMMKSKYIDTLLRKETWRVYPSRDVDSITPILFYFFLFQVPIAIGGPGLAAGVRFRNDVPSGGLANVAATVINLHGFEAPGDYEPTLIEVVD